MRSIGSSDVITLYDAEGNAIGVITDPDDGVRRLQVEATILPPSQIGGPGGGPAAIPVGAFDLRALMREQLVELRKIRFLLERMSGVEDIGNIDFEEDL